MLKRLLRNLGPGAPVPAATGAASSGNPLQDYAERNHLGRAIDKWTHYFDAYHRHFARFRGLPITVIEIGVYNGGSLRMWREYFGPQSKIVGVDINPDCARFAETGVDVIIGDQSDRGFLRALRESCPAPSILIDDGGHGMEQQIATFEEMYLHLVPDGVFVCEDIHTSYWNAYAGGLCREGTFIEYSKKLIDKLNAHFVEGGALPVDEFTRRTGSMHFYDSMLVIERRDRAPPVRRYYGSEQHFATPPEFSRGEPS
jgi:hypothetical protein